MDHDDNVPLAFHLCDIGIIEKSLATLYWSDRRRDVQIWVMNDHLVPDSCVLKFRLGTSNFWPRGFWKNSLITADKQFLYFYDTPKNEETYPSTNNFCDVRFFQLFGHPADGL